MGSEMACWPGSRASQQPQIGRMRWRAVRLPVHPAQGSKSELVRVMEPPAMSSSSGATQA